LKADYQRRVRGDFDPVEPGARLPIDREHFAIGYGYGPRASAFHPGVDFAANPGTPIYAVMPGTVCCANNLEGTGLWSVTISNANLDTVYVFRSNGSRIAVGDRITASSQIATIGPETYTTDEFLHFEVYADGRHTNPVRHLANMGLQPWPPAGRPRPVSGTYPPATPCTITTID
jgi:murein DD-endopeptidase MepM/ murein hydrolase activator NlpD